MKTTLILITLLLSCLALTAQERKEIKGMMYDSETRQALEDGHIYIEGTHIGTVSNQSGHFNLVCRDFPKDAKLKCSFVGFETVEMKVKDIQAPFIRVAMTPAVLQLPEIVIYAEKPTILTKSIEGAGKKF
jgi:hypothetical protein